MSVWASTRNTSPGLQDNTGALDGSNSRDASLALDADHGAVRQAPEEVVHGAIQVGPILGLERHLDLVFGVRELGIGTQHELGMLAEHRVQVIGEDAFADAHEDTAEVKGRLAEAFLERLELLTKDL